MLNIFQQYIFQQYMNWEFPDGFRKSRGTRIQIANICWTIDKTREFQRNIYFCFTDYPKSFDWMGDNNSERIWISNHLTCLLRTCMEVKKQQLELDTEQWTGSKLGKEYVKVVYCHPSYLTYMHITSWEMLGWMKSKLESRLSGEISIASCMQMTPPLWQKVKN